MNFIITSATTKIHTHAHILKIMKRCKERGERRKRKEVEMEGKIEEVLCEKLSGRKQQQNQR